MAQTMRRIVWLSVLGGIGAAGWKFWSSQQADNDNDKGNWAPVPNGGKSANATTSTQRFAADSSAAPSGAATKSAGGSSSGSTSSASASSDKAKPNATSSAGGSSNGGSSAGGSSTGRSSKGSSTASGPSSSGGGAGATKAGKQLWVEPGPKGSCPADFPVKANQSSKIYHVPSGGSYGRTKAERCYATPEDAEADGYRASKR